MGTKTLDPKKVFTTQMVLDAKKCANTKEIEDRVIIPNMGRINENAGQENLSVFWADVMENYLNELKRLSE